MNISSVSSIYSYTAVKPETAKQDSQTNQQIEKQTEVSDSFTKSAAADEALRSLSDKTSKAEGNTVVSSEQLAASATADSKPSTGKPEAAKITAEAQAVNTETSSATTINVETSAEEETSSQTSEIISETSSSSSEYTAAEIAEYDTNGDGEIDASEEAKMLAAQAKAAASETSKEKSSIQTMSREAYQTAKQQLQAPPANEYQFSQQV